MNTVSKAVVTVLGIDCKGIIARVSNVLWQYSVNILDISQTIVDGYFNMIMIVDITAPSCSFDILNESLQKLGNDLHLQIRIQRSEIFEAMHQV